MTTKNKMDILKSRYMEAKTDSEREAVFDEIRAEIDIDAKAVAQATLEQLKDTNARIEEEITREKIKNILPIISLSYIAKNYFGKTKSWLYQRVNGNLVNGKPAKFTDEEKEILNSALKDIANRLMKTCVS